MTCKTKNKNLLSSKQDLQHQIMTWVSALDRQFTWGESGIELGATCAHYGPQIAKMEGLSRVLWGLFPLMAGGVHTPLIEKYIEAIRQGTNPASEHYWGTTVAYDQKLVEMAVYGLGLALLQQDFTGLLSTQEQHNLYTWLEQITDAEMPDSNWNYFAIMVQLGFKQVGWPWQPEKVAERFARMDAYYLGDGWYSDGVGRPKDYYISMAFHYYGLIYATLMAEEDAPRARILRERASLFARDFIYFSDSQGASIPFGRSLTYRFAMVAFWSAVAFAQLDVQPQGVIKGIILRHLRWWQEQPMLDRDGLLTLGFAYPNLIMCEDYNSPGSPYWALKTYLILALPDEHPFWQAEELPLPALPCVHAIPHASQLLCRSKHSDHAYLLTAGQLELNNYVNTEAKYTKFAYSSRYGFTVERGRYGLQHAACDSMLLLSEKDQYFRGRRNCELVTITPQWIYSRWHPWADVHIDTWLIPCGLWHVRIHQLHTDRALDCVEGGFAIPYDKHAPIDVSAQHAHVTSVHDVSVIHDASPQARDGSYVVTPPNSSITFAESAVIPTLTQSLAPGHHILISVVAANHHHLTEPPHITMTESVVTITSDEMNEAYHVTI